MSDKRKRLTFRVVWIGLSLAAAFFGDAALNHFVLVPGGVDLVSQTVVGAILGFPLGSLSWLLMDSVEDQIFPRRYGRQS